VTNFGREIAEFEEEFDLDEEKYVVLGQNTREREVRRGKVQHERD
jgi:hypothetical protein